MPAYILWGVVRAHGNSYNQTMYKWSVHMVMENNKVKKQWGCQRRTIGCPYKADHRTGWGFDGNPLGSDAKSEAMPEGGVEPE